MTVPDGVTDFYDRLAAGYDREFDAPHRKAYDDLAWEVVTGLLPPRPATVVDVGCGSGRWAERLVAMGHTVVGVEPTPRMVDVARAKALVRFTVLPVGVDEADVPAASADLVIAMGSIQYAADPEASIVRMARWVAPGGHLAVLCDSLVALALELLARGDVDQCAERLATARAEWVRDGATVHYHLFDAGRLRRAFAAAGLADVSVRGLLIAASALGRDRLHEALQSDPDAILATDRRVGAFEALADAGKQLLAVGRRR